MLERCFLRPEVLNLEADLEIIGDLNARVGRRDDFINDNHVIPLLSDYEEYLIDEEVGKRELCDTQINRFGLDLIHCCETSMLQICNGRQGADRGIGHFTFAGVNGNSVIDYALCSNNVTHMIQSFKVAERTESSHFTINIGLWNSECTVSTTESTFLIIQWVDIISTRTT